MSSTSWNPQRPSPDLADRPQRRGVRGLPGSHVPPWREGPAGVLPPMPAPGTALGPKGGVAGDGGGRDPRDPPLCPDGQASPARPRPDATGNSVPLGARPRRMTALRAGGRGRDPDRAASISNAAPSGASLAAAHTPRSRPRRQRRCVCCPSPESGGWSRPGRPGAPNPQPGMPTPPGVRGGAPP